jgi:acyl carrier protein phosphodiesterase
MNYLAHAFLSFGDPNLLVGNMISDYVKGKQQFEYPPNIKRGIDLHRSIDQFTDAHPATKAAKQFFAPVYRLYAGAFVDVVYDHFLAQDEHHFPTELALQTFSQQCYRQLEVYPGPWPEKFARMVPYMIRQNWFYHYRMREGIEQSFGGLIRRTQHLTDAEPAKFILQENKPALQQCYAQFMPDMVRHVKNWIDEHPPVGDELLEKL